MTNAFLPLLLLIPGGILSYFFLRDMDDWLLEHKSLRSVVIARLRATKAFTIYAALFFIVLGCMIAFFLLWCLGGFNSPGRSARA